MNKQPFYCVLTVLFTATRELSESEVAEAVKKSLLKIPGVLAPGKPRGGVIVEAFECEAGDPADLM